MVKHSPEERSSPHSAGLTPPDRGTHEILSRVGIDARRLSIFKLGRPPELLWKGHPPWLRRLMIGSLLWALVAAFDRAKLVTPVVHMWASLAVGLVVLQAACDALVTASERLAARKRWDHYVAGTVAEILSTLPEFVVISFIVVVSPVTAVIVALVTIYNNALVFSLYSYFLPKDKKGYYVMPVAITEAGQQVLIAGAAIGAALGFVMLTAGFEGGGGRGINAGELIVVALIMWGVFAAYAYTLVTAYASEEGRVHQALNLSPEEIAKRKAEIYTDVKQVSGFNIAGVFLVGVLAAFAGGERVSSFAEAAISDLGLSEVATAVILAAFAGMSEYVILWRAHHRSQHGIALANAFGGITQVMFLVVPFTLLAVGLYQLFGPGHPELPLHFNPSLTLLTGLLFPTFYVLTALLQEDHTFGFFDTIIMGAVCLLVLLVLVTA